MRMVKKDDEGHDKVYGECAYELWEKVSGNAMAKPRPIASQFGIW